MADDAEARLHHDEAEVEGDAQRQNGAGGRTRIMAVMAMSVVGVPVARSGRGRGGRHRSTLPEPESAVEPLALRCDKAAAPSVGSWARAQAA